MPQQAPDKTETVEIVKLGHAGDGVSADGVFVPYTLPGDVVRIAREGSKARLIEILTPGPARTTPPCRHFGRCGGCALQHVELASYLSWKRDLVVTALKQRGFENIEVDDVHAVAPGTRRRANFKARADGRGVQLGFYEPESRTLVDLAECPVLVPGLASIMPSLRMRLMNILRAGETAELFATLTDSGIDLALKVQRSRDANLLTSLAALASGLKLARLSWNGEEIAIAEKSVIRVGHFTVALPVDAFLQPTRDGERFLQDAVVEAAAKASRVADLFSGCGTFALMLAESNSVHAVDNLAPQIDALTAAARGERSPAKWIPVRSETARQKESPRTKVTGEVRDLFRRPLLPAELKSFDTVVLDPPRPGAREQSGELARSDVARVLYVSCNPASFARDARILADGGYRLERVRPLDQFLWSPHLELFATFTR